MGLALLVSLAAAVGAVARYVLDIAIQRRHASGLPWGTFAINLSGSLTLGLITGLAVHHGLGTHAVSVLGAACWAGTRRGAPSPGTPMRWPTKVGGRQQPST